MRLTWGHNWGERKLLLSFHLFFLLPGIWYSLVRLIFQVAVCKQAVHGQFWGITLFLNFLLVGRDCLATAIRVLVKHCLDSHWWCLFQGITWLTRDCTISYWTDWGKLLTQTCHYKEKKVSECTAFTIHPVLPAIRYRKDKLDSQLCKPCITLLRSYQYRFLFHWLSSSLFFYVHFKVIKLKYSWKTPFSTKWDWQCCSRGKHIFHRLIR